MTLANIFQVLQANCYGIKFSEKAYASCRPKSKIKILAVHIVSFGRKVDWIVELCLFEDEVRASFLQEVPSSTGTCC